MSRTVNPKFASPSDLETRAVRQQGVQRVAAAQPGGVAAPMACGEGSVVQNKVPGSEAKRHAAMSRSANLSRGTAAVVAAAVGSQGALPDIPVHAR